MRVCLSTLKDRLPAPRSRVAAAGALVALVLLAAVAPAGAAEPLFARCDTDSGSILLVLQPELAPHHVANFATLARRGFYDGTYFHRVIPGFMIQGGDPNTRNADRADDGTSGPTWADVLTKEELAVVQAAAPLRGAGAGADPAAPAKIAAADKVLAQKGYVWQRPEAASLKAEFSPTANHLRGTLSMARTSDPNTAGSQFFICVATAASLDKKYTIFGRVVSGLPVVDKIVAAKRDARDNPLQSCHIRKMTIVSGVAGLTAAEKAAWAGAGKAGG
ncbi:MAG: peptidylprolyl isomerase [Candidatus Krumholzibacteriia bacterium]